MPQRLVGKRVAEEAGPAAAEFLRYAKLQKPLPPQPVVVLRGTRPVPVVLDCPVREFGRQLAT